MNSIAEAIANRGKLHECQDMRNLPVRRCTIRHRLHPEWGTWAVYEDHGEWYDIWQTGGGRTLDKTEAEKLWERMA